MKLGSRLETEWFAPGSRRVTQPCGRSWSNAATKPGLSQTDLAKRLRRSQSYVSYVETGQKLVEVVELMEWADAIGFDLGEIIKRLAKVPRR